MDREVYRSRALVQRMVRVAIKSGELRKPDTCERCGDASKRLEGHHADYAQPLEVEWLCQPCHARHHAQIRNAELRQQAQELRDEGLSFAAIGERTGKATMTVWRLLNPEGASRHSRQPNQRRKEAKLAWKRANDTVQCPVCGARMRSVSSRCRSCFLSQKRERNRDKLSEIQRRWLAGETLKEIAVALNTTPGSIKYAKERMRSEGYYLPYVMQRGKRAA